MDPSKTLKKSELEKMIHEHGGTFKRNGDPDTTGEFVVFGVSPKLSKLRELHPHRPQFSVLAAL